MTISINANAAAPIQLELFPRETGLADPTHAVRCESARASVSPGWWPFVRALFDPTDEIVVQVCEERDGDLILEAAPADPASGTLDVIIARIRDATSRTCGCCGSRGAQLVRISLDGPTRRVCAACEGRLRQGEEYLAIADEFWRLDGTRRGGPLQVTMREVPGAVPFEEAARPLVVLAPGDLRTAIREIRDRLAEEVVGHREIIDRLALLGGLHVGAGLPRGGRALLIGPSGAGKTSLMSAFRRALAPWGLPWTTIAATDLNSVGWAGGIWIGAAIESSLGRLAPDSPLARHAVVTVDELAHARVDNDVSGNMRAKQQEVLASLLGLTGYGLPIQLPESRRAWSSDEALVIGIGAFSGILDVSRPISVQDVVGTGGIPLELATRLAGELLVMERLAEEDLVALLRRWPELTSLVEICGRLGYVVQITPEAYRHAARVVTLNHDSLTARTAGAWLVAGLRRALVAALDDADRDEIVITPDSLPIPSTAAMPPRRERGFDSGPDFQPI